MLRPRAVNTLTEDVGPEKLHQPRKLKSNNKLKNRANINNGPDTKVNELRGGLAVKPRPLHASTNTIHTQQHKSTSIKQQNSHDKNSPTEDDLLKKKISSTSKSDDKTTPKLEPKTDENDTTAFVANSYNPLLDFYPFDEELYQKVLNLELANDGLPTFVSDEPFDF